MSSNHPFMVRRHKRLITSAVVISLACLVILGIGLYSLRRIAGNVTQTAQSSFDPSLLVRTSDVSRVFRIRANPIQPAKVWFCAQEGLHVFDLDKIEWHRYGLDHGLPSESVTDIAFQNSVAWVGTAQGIAYMDSSAKRFHAHPSSAHERILSLEYLAGKGIYYYADEKGLFQIENSRTPAVAVQVPGALREAPITCLAAVGNYLYAGIAGTGIFQYDPVGNKWKQLPLDRRISKVNYFYDIRAFRGHLWVTSSEEGIFRGDSSSDTLRYLESFPAKGAYVMAPEQDGFWCGTPWGLWRYYLNNDIWVQFVHPNERNPGDFHLFALHAQDDKLWYGSKDMGAGFFNKINVEWHPLRAGLSRRNVTAIACNDTLLWTGYGYQGGYTDRFDAEGVQYDRNFSYYDGIGEGNIQVLSLSGNELYYAGFNGFGRYDFRRNKHKYFDKSSFLPASDIVDLANTDGIWFLASAHGLITYDPASDSFSSIKETRNFRVTCLHDEGDSLWFGTLSQGLRVFSKGRRSVSGGIIEGDRIVGIASFKEQGKRPVLFVGVKTKGLYELDLGSGRANPLQEIGKAEEFARHANNIMAMRSMDGRIWIGTRESGCIIFDPKTRKTGVMTSAQGLSGNQIRSFAETEKYLWIGCYGGLNRIEKKYAGRIIRWR